MRLVVIKILKELFSMLKKGKILNNKLEIEK
jgi:hypothetical protein